MSNEFKLVPVEPTDDMVVAFAEAWYSKRQAYDDPDIGDAYAAMLAAAPQPPALGGEPEDLHLNPCKSCQGKFGGLKTYENALGKFHYVQCGSCEARTLGSTEITDVVAAWNKSSAEDQPVPVRMDIQIQRWDPDLLEATKLYFGRNEAHNFQIYLSGEFSRSKNKAQQPITVAGFRVTSPQTGKSKFYLPQKAHLMPSFANGGYHITELIDHAHLAPLHAEIDHLKQKSERQLLAIQTLMADRNIEKSRKVRARKQRDELKARCDAMEAAIAPFVKYARAAGLPASLGVTTGSGHFEVSREDWRALVGPSKPAGSEQ